MSKFLIGAVSALSMVAGSAFAAEESKGMYVGVHAGVAMPKVASSFVVDVPAVATSVSTALPNIKKTSPVIGLSVGNAFEITPEFKLAVEAQFEADLASKKDTIAATAASPATSRTFGRSMDLALRARGIFNVGFADVYGILGLGFSRVNLEAAMTDTSVTPNVTYTDPIKKFVPYFTVGLGAEKEIAKDIKMFADFSYSQSFKKTSTLTNLSKAATPATLKLNYKVTNMALRIGARYYF